MNNGQMSVAWVIFRGIAAISLLVGIVLWLSFRVEQNRIASACVVSGSLLVYLTLSYFFVPDLKRMRPSFFSFSYEVRRRSTMRLIRLFFIPGRLLAICLLDVVAMLLGKSIDHEETKVDVKL